MQGLAEKLVLVACISLSPAAFAENAAGSESESATEAVAEPAAPESRAPEAESPDYSLSAVVERMRAAREKDQLALQARESRYADRRDAAQERLEKARATLARREAEGRRLEVRFEDNRVTLDERTIYLKEKIGALKELFGVFQQNASDLIGAFVGSPTSLEYPDRDTWLEGFANRMKNTSEVTSTEDIRRLWFEVLREIDARGEVVEVMAPVYDAEGDPSPRRKLVRLGGFHLITAEGRPSYLQWDTARQRAEYMDRQPGREFTGTLGNWARAVEPTAVSVDPTGGVLASLLARKPNLAERLEQGGVVGMMILVLGAIALVLGLFKLLDISWISLRVALQQRDIGKPSDRNALGRILLEARERSRCDPELLEIHLHDRVGRESDRVHRFTVFLAIIAAVAPLMGLLGTVVGMINTFQAITLFGTGDPQTMAGGISQALITTVLGLIVAVPAVLLHAAVQARGNAVAGVLKRQMALLLGDRIDEVARPEAVGLSRIGAGTAAVPQPETR